MHHLRGRYSADGGTRPAAATPPEQVASAGGAGAGEGGGQWVEPLLGAPQLREPLLVPKELWRMADWLWRHGLGAEELFQRPAEEGGVAQVREALDTNQPFPEDTSPHAVADALVRFLEALPWPVVPRSLQPVHLVDAGELPLWSARLLAQLPPLAHNVFVYVCAFLREAVKHASGNGLTAEAIGAWRRMARLAVTRTRTHAHGLTHTHACMPTQPKCWALRCSSPTVWQATP